MNILTPFDGRQLWQPRFFSLWRGGPLGLFEWLAAKSFVDYGYEYKLYTYDSSIKVPSGVQVGDASDICSQQDLDRFTYIGSETGSRYSAGSDYFRYCAIRETSDCWVDTDIVCLSPHISTLSNMFLAKEDTYFFNVAVFGARGSACILVDHLISECDTLSSEGPLPWGLLSPKLITSVLNEHYPQLEAECQPRASYYPLHWSETHLLFDPSESDNVAIKAASSWCIHLWNEVLTREGRRSSVPVPGSFLHKLFLRHAVI